MCSCHLPHVMLPSSPVPKTATASAISTLMCCSDWNRKPAGQEATDLMKQEDSLSLTKKVFS